MSSTLTDKKVTAAYAKTNLPELLKAVEQGQTITISRYNKPVADLVPSKQAVKPAPKFGTLKGKIKIIDPHCFDPMTDEEVDAFIEGRY
jgi:prevent-host-death family protein